MVLVCLEAAIGIILFLEVAQGYPSKSKTLIQLLATPLGHQKTVAKWLVISETRREINFSVQHILSYVSNKIS